MMRATEHTTLNQRSKKQDLVGWVLESPGRGTLQVITTCLFTLFLCTWAVIHPRVEVHRRLRWPHKFALFLKTLVAPEFIAVEGLQEWSQAQTMMKDCAQPTGGGLEYIHAYYIGMLALRYRTSNRGNRVIWPNQYTWLLREKLIDWTDHETWGLAKDAIRDKSNADGFVKLAALCQVLWFVVQCVLRAVHNLPLSQLETMTVSYIPLFIVTYIFWWPKPKDIKTPSYVILPTMTSEQQETFEAMAVSNKFDYDRNAALPSLWSVWSLTPRVFEKEAADKAMEDAKREAAKKAAAQEKDQKVALVAVTDPESATMTTGDMSKNHEEQPIPHVRKETVVAYWDPSLYQSKLWPLTCLFGASFGALHLISWNTTFPTQIEQWLWRAAALTSIVSMLVFMQYRKVVLRFGGPLTMIAIASPVLYLLSRIVMMVGVIIAFRAMDSRVYQTFVVSTYWVHIV